MMLQEKFDNIIDCIEKLISLGETDIPQALSRETGFNLRVLGDAFQFMSEMTLVKYIRQRRLVYALAKKNEFSLAVEDIVTDAGFSDAAAFSKACKNEFDLTPIQITEKILKQYVPLSFTKVASGRSTDYTENDTLISTKNDTICGVTAEQFAEIKTVLELGAIYGLSDEEAEFVYRLSQFCEITSAQAAEFYEDFKLQIENGSAAIGPDLFEMAELACQYNLSYSETQEVMYELHCHGYDSLAYLPIGFFDIYFCEENNRHGWDVPYICEIIEAMESNGLSTDEIDDIALLASNFGVDILEAIENYDSYQTLWDRMIDDTMSNGIPDDDSGGFGYRSIWELDEE